MLNQPTYPGMNPLPSQELRRVMEGVGAGLRVPLAAKVKMGQRWGSLAAVE